MLPWLAFAACSLIWGSTWLAHKWALVDFTPLGLAAVRFLAAGVICLLIARMRGERFVERQHLPSLLLSGLIMAGIANVVTAWTLLYIPSGVGAVLQAPIPIWMALMTMRREPLPAAGWVAVLLGFLGVAIVSRPDASGGIDPVAALICAAMPVAWCWASLHQVRHVRSGGLYANAGVQMLASGVLGMGLAGSVGEFTHAGEVGQRAWLATAYLVIGGSVIAFASYQYLARVWHPARAGSFAYVNPVIAVLLGWALGAEALTPTLVAGMAVILAAVAVLQWRGRRASEGSSQR